MSNIEVILSESEPSHSQSAAAPIATDIVAASTQNGQSSPNEAATPTIPPPHAPSADLITDYVNYADRFELPRIMHELTIMTGIAALVNGKVVIKNGGQQISFDFWTLLITRSGGGRNTLASVFYDLLKACDKADLISTEGWGSGIYMQEFFAKHSVVFHVWEEMSAMMQK